MMPKGRRAITGKKKEYMLRIRLDEDERDRVEARAAQLGKGASTYARDLLLTDSPPLQPAKPATKKAPSAGKKPKA